MSANDNSTASSSEPSPSARSLPPQALEATQQASGLLRIETAAAGLLAATAVILSFRVWLNGGGLWRDEVNSVNLVAWPIAEIWKNLQYDSFPILWCLALKGWIAIFGGSDPAIRGLGLATGVGIVAAVWWTSRTLGARVPLISLSLFALASTVVVYGSAVRAYGMGAALIVLTLGAMWKMIEKPTLWRISAACLAAILSVQCLYHNCALLFGIGVGTAAACVARRQWKTAILPLAIGAVAAATMLPYRQTAAEIGNWNSLVKQPVDLPYLLGRFTAALYGSKHIILYAWLGPGLAGLAICARSLLLRREVAHLPAKSTAVFVLVTEVVVLSAYFAFLSVLSYATQVWYYLPLAALVVLLIEASVSSFLSASRWASAFRILVVLAVAVLLTRWSWEAGGQRQSNVDLVCTQLKSLVDKDDYIVVDPFYLGVTFSRYYRGAAPWTTLPDIAEHRVHRYDLVMAKMAEPRPISPMLERIQQTLRSGHRVWIVIQGNVQLSSRSQPPDVLPPAPNSSHGWDFGAYQDSWTQQLAAAIQSAESVRTIAVPCDRPLGPLEGAVIVEVKGPERIGLHRAE